MTNVMEIPVKTNPMVISDMVVKKGGKEEQIINFLKKQKGREAQRNDILRYIYPGIGVTGELDKFNGTIFSIMVKKGLLKKSNINGRYILNVA